MEVNQSAASPIASQIPPPGAGPAPILRHNHSPSAGPMLPPPAVATEKNGEATQEDQLEFSRRFAALSKQSRELNDKQKKNKEREEQYQTYESLKSDPKSNALKILEHFGLSYEDITNIMLADPEQEPTTEEQLQALKKRLDDDAAAKKKTEDEEVSAAEAKVIEDAKNRIAAHIESKGDTYELIRLNNAHGMVWDVVDEYYTTHGVLPSVDDAALAVENYLEEKLKPFVSAKKFSSTSTPNQSPAAPAPRAIEELRRHSPQQKRQPPTLSADAMNSSGPVSNPNGSQRLTREERIRRAAQKLVL